MDDITELIPNEVTEDGDTRPIEPSSGPPGRAGGPSSGGGQNVGDVWSVDKRGKKYVSAQGRKGVVYQQGSETVAEALDRDKRGREQRPRRKQKTPPVQPAPTKADLKELEHMLTEVLSSPAAIGAMAGDTWTADHFTTQAPVLARNVVVAAEHNPWLRRKLEALANGEAMTLQLMTIAPVVISLLVYAGLPLIYWLNLPVSEQTRLMFNIPDRRKNDAEPQAPADAYAAAA